MSSTKTIILVLAFAIGSGAAQNPCSQVTPTPHIHIDDSNGGFNPSATCPDGWVVSITSKASEAYNRVRTQAAAVNMLADAPCVRKRDSK